MKRLVALSAVLVLLLVGCGDDDGEDLDDLTTTPTEETTEPDEGTTTEAPDEDEGDEDEGDEDEDSDGGEPDSYGDDDELDTLWDDCDDDDACGQLWLESPVGSEYEEFGGSCGGRSETNECGVELDINPDADTYGDDDELDALWDACDDGNEDACSELFWTSPAGSEYETFGSTCGGRGDEGDCTEMVGMDELEDLLGE